MVQNTRCRRRSAAATAALAFAMSLAGLSWAPGASAVSGYFSGAPGNCTDCHAATPTTCKGCHAHGTHSSVAGNGINITGRTNTTSYNPGQTVQVTISGGVNTGWVRAILYNQNMVELARSTGTATGGMGGGASTPVTLNAPAPTTPGTYTWNVAWYGHEYDGASPSYGPRWTPDPNNPNHGQEIVATNQFTVVAPPPAAAPDINLNPASLNFGTVSTPASSTLTAQVQNLGNAALNVTGVTRCAGTSAEYTFSPATAFTVPPGGNTTLSVTYRPTAAGTDSGCIQIASNDATTPTVPLNVSGTGNVPPPAAQPDINPNPASLGFGTVTVGSPATLTTQVQNLGTASLNITSIARCTGTSTEFTFSPAGPLTVAAGASTPVTVTYAPTAAGSDSGCIQINSNDPATPAVQVTVSGTGNVPAPPPAPGISLNPTSVNFNTVSVGNGATLPVTVQNTGNAALSISGIALCSGTSTEYAATPAAPITVAAGASATLSVHYNPTNAGTDTGCLQITSNATATPVSLAVTGAGVNPAGAPDISLGSGAVAFGSVTVGGSATQTVQVRNIGTASLVVSAISRCAGTSSEFAVTTQAPLTIAAGSSAAVSMTYRPAAAGADTGCIEFASNDAGNPTVPLPVSGSGVAPPAAGALDLDIRTLRARSSVNLAERQSVAITLSVVNAGQVAGQAAATVVGMQNGRQVYARTVSVSDPLTLGSSSFTFPSYTPTRVGAITWTATIADGNTDIDRVSVTTLVVAGEEHEEEDD